MNITAILITLIVGFVVVTVFSLMALLFVRRRERERERKYAIEDSARIFKAIEDLDVALDSALTELNKMGALVKEDIDEKYKSMLFLYNLVEDKQKEIAATTDGDAISKMMERQLETYGTKLRLIAENAARSVAPRMLEIPLPPLDELPAKPAPPARPVVPKEKPRPKFTNPKHMKIWEMRENGRDVASIAKELGMGQGEVKLILDLAEKAS